VNESSRSQPAAVRDYTKGSILRSLLRLSLPLVVSNTATILGPVIDMIWVGRLGPVAVAAVASGGIVVGLMITINMGLVVGTRAMISRCIGAEDNTGALHLAQQSLIVSLTFSVAVSLIGFIFAESIFRVMGLDADVVAEGTFYLRIMFVATGASSFRMMAEGIMQASGDAVLPMRIAIVNILLRLILAPLLIFGNEILPWWFFAGIGIEGSAFAMLIAHVSTMVLLLWLLFTGRSLLRVTLRNMKIDLKTIRNIIKVGFPALVSMMQRNLSQLILVRFVAPFGTVAVAAHGIVQRVEMLVITPIYGLGMGAGVLVGQNLGAQQPRRAEKSSWLALMIAQAFILTCSAAMLLWPTGVVRIFSSDSDLLAATGPYIQIAAIGYLAIGFWVVFAQCINGAGDTLPVMVLSVLVIWLVTMPSAYLLPKYAGLGIYGVRWGMAIGMIAAALAYLIYFLTGRWKRKQL
jgi:putative MATE family efflux protein